MRITGDRKPMGPVPLIIGITPFEEPAPNLCAALGAAGALGVLDLGSDDRRARAALAELARLVTAVFGVRIGPGCPLDPDTVRGLAGDHLAAVVLAHDAPWPVGDVPADWMLLAEIVSLEEARQAIADGADGLIARGSEAGGRVGDLSSFVLVQQLLDTAEAGDVIDAPVWLCGGIGEHTAAAAIAGGAAGVVLDTQLTLLAESDVDPFAAAVLNRADGSESVVADGRRTLSGFAMGQDAFVASGFAARYGTTGRAVTAIRRSIRAIPDHPFAFAADSPMARSLGMRLPVAQGPMTRVSDVPAFAEAVAEQGALPFLALAQASGPQAADLLVRTSTLLGERPWGVGILGFVPDDLREAQLAAIIEARPGVALIAGGRPAQAARLEAEGIPAFLHVSSPELLAGYWEAGTRRFVFEGAECGGHIGPRASFPLWEAQIQVLLELITDPCDAQIFFAGGVHDRRSAAMVSALAAPLAARGVAVGLLMGTAYLFTEEAVVHGAIQAEFQHQAIAADHTVVLHTAPGHATRCLPTPYTQDFARHRDGLAASGVAKQEMWERLEQLNVGRLRIASKALRRTGDRLETVDADEQAASGLYLAGQSAALHSGTTTIAGLHREVTEEAGRFHAEASCAVRVRLGANGADQVTVAPPPLGIAIVGMACVFPGASSPAEFWRNTVDNVDCVTEVPADRWSQDAYFDPAAERSKGDSTPSRWGGFLPAIAFDPLRYGIPPASLPSIEPAQLLGLEVARRALDDAGFADGGFDRERTAVVFGAEPGGELSSAVDLRMLLPGYGPVSQDFVDRLPRVTEDTFPGRLGNVISGRIANRLDLGGANFTVDAACASSLAAIEVACRQLVAGTADVVLCGAVDLHNAVTDFLLFSSVGALSPSGRCAAFDSAADGIALGEGAACLVLKRVADAERDGDRVYAVIDGVGAASDGRALGLVAPRPEGQHRALTRAYANARISPARVGLVEAHGTGTVVGDRTELEVLTDLFTEAGAEVGGCALGSVKSQIGHTKCAAGLAGLIRSALAVHSGVKPPTAHVRRPNAAWRGESSPFVLNASAVPWFADPVDRVAGVSAFGFGGTDFHVVVRGHASASATGNGQEAWPAELFLFRGRTVEHAKRDVERLLTSVRANEQAGEPWTLRDFAFTASQRADASPEPVRFAVVADDLRHLGDALGAAVEGSACTGLMTSAASGDDGKLAVLFPGQGSQRPGMVSELLVTFPAVRRFASPDAAVLRSMLPPTAYDEDTIASHREVLRDTRMAQPGLGFADLAVFELLRTAGVVPDMVAGHSYGEVVALCAAGALDAAELPRISALRAEALVAAAGSDPGAMAAVAAGAAEVERVLAAADGAGEVVIANLNAPRQTVVSGPSDAVAAAVRAFRDQGLTVHPLPVSCAFHSPVVAGAVETFAEALAGFRIAAPVLPVWSNRTGGEYRQDSESVRAELGLQLAAPVRFAEQIEAMYAAGARTFVEAGPGRVLGALVDAILSERPHTTVACDGGVRGLLEALATVAVHGADVRLGRLLRARGARDVGSWTPPPRPGWLLDGHAIRTADGAYLPGGYSPPRPTGEMMMADRSDRGAAVADFLRTSRDLIAAQRDVLLGYLAAPQEAGAVAQAPQVVQTHVARAIQLPATTAAAATATAAASATATAGAVARPDSLTAIVAEIADRTGYPPEMIDTDLDLEADLGVDSIKRTEIAAAVCRTLGIDGADPRFDEVVKRRTVRTMAEVLAEGELAAPTAGDSSSLVAAGSADLAAPASAVAAGSPDLAANLILATPRRLILDPGPIPSPPADLAGRRVLLLGDAPDLARELAVRGAVAPGERPDGVVFADSRDLAESFPALRDAVLANPDWVLDVSSAPGAKGLFRSIAAEFPAIDVRTAVVRPVPRELRLTATGSGPEAPGRAEARALGLTADSVVLVIGGARGIAARCALTLTAASGCRLELAGRTVLAESAEDPLTAGAPDLRSLRSALAGVGITSPARIEQQARALLAQREVAATLAAAAEHGGARYRPLDVRDPAAVTQLVKQVHAEHGRLDGVVFAAGVIEDRLLADKDPDSFRRVFATKVDGATALLAALDGLPEPPGFTVLFGSVAAVWGSRGQSDYAAANDALDTLAALWADRTGSRALTIHWGPWAPVGEHPGMVSDEVARAAIALGGAVIDPDAGAHALLAELAWGSPELRSIVYTASLPGTQQ